GETLFLDQSPDDSPFYQRVLLPAGARPARVQIVAQSRPIVELVKAGMGIAVLARWEIQPCVKAGRLCALPLSCAGERRRWRAAALKDMADVSFVREFIDVLARATGAPPKSRPAA